MLRAPLLPPLPSLTSVGGAVQIKELLFMAVLVGKAGANLASLFPGTSKAIAVGRPLTGEGVSCNL